MPHQRFRNVNNPDNYRGGGQLWETGKGLQKPDQKVLVRILSTPSALPWGKSIQAVPGWKPPAGEHGGST